MNDDGYPTVLQPKWHWFSREYYAYYWEYLVLVVVLVLEVKLSNARNLTNHFILHRSSCPIDAGAVMVAKGLHYFNSVLNPIIYSLMNKQFKTAFKHLFYLTYSNLSGRGPMMTRLDVDKQLSFTYFSSLKSRSSMQEKSRAEENNFPQRV